MPAPGADETDGRNNSISTLMLHLGQEQRRGAEEEEELEDAEMIGGGVEEMAGRALLPSLLIISFCCWDSVEERGSDDSPE